MMHDIVAGGIAYVQSDAGNEFVQGYDGLPGIGAHQLPVFIHGRDGLQSIFACLCCRSYKTALIRLFLGAPAQTGKYGLKTISSMDEYRQLVSTDPRQAIVALDKFIPGIRLDIRYATSNNIMHHPMYRTATAFLRRPAAEALREIQQELQPMGYGLKVYDGYRPYRVTVDFYEAYHDSNFVASPIQAPGITGDAPST